MRKRALRAGLLSLSILLAGCGVATPEEFVVTNARAHLAHLAGTIGSRPLGSEATRRARAYLADQLRAAGFDVSIQEVEARRPELGLTGRVANLVARRAGARPDAVALVAHYDSVPYGPGAGDDGFGAAVVVEAGRALVAGGLRHTLFVLLTDGEEAGLLGAAGLLQDRALVGRLRAYLNFDAIGSARPVVLFETGPGGRWLVDTWRRAAPYPRGGSYAIEVYRRLPNDTDFSILKRTGVPGLNFALVGDGYAYHTDRDTADRVDARALVEAGANAVAVIRALDRQDLSRAPGDLASSSGDEVTYFDLLGWRGLTYGKAARRGLAVAAVLAGLLAWWRVARATVHGAGLRRLLLTGVWGAAGGVVTAGALLGATAALRAAREVLHPWYAHPERFLWLLLASGGAGAWLTARLAARPRWRGAAHPSAIWAVSLPLWIGATLLAETRAPTAAFLWTVPLLTSAVVLLVVDVRRAVAVRVGSVLVCAVAGVLWARDTVRLFEFAVTVFGRQPGVTPVWTLPALLLLAAAMIGPPLAAVAVAPERPGSLQVALSSAVLIALTATAALTVAAPAYTADRPLHRVVRYVQDTASGAALWEIGGHEPGLDVTGAGRGLAWQASRGAPFASPAVPPLRHPFVFRARAPRVGLLPGAVEARLRPMNDRVALEVQVVPGPDLAAATLWLPPDVVPLESALPGRIEGRRGWRATYVNLPPAGVSFRVTVAPPAASRLADAVVVLESARLPDAAPGRLLPAWLAREPVTWTSRALYLVALGPRLAAPPLVEASAARHAGDRRRARPAGRPF